MTQRRPNREQRRRTDQTSQAGIIPDRVDIRFVRSNLCRIIRVDGAYGGPTAQGNIHMAIYADRTHTPEGSRLILDSEQRTVQEQITSSGPGWTREVEADLIISIDTARAIRDWLDRQLKQITSGESAVYTAASVEPGV